MVSALRCFIHSKSINGSCPVQLLVHRGQRVLWFCQLGKRVIPGSLLPWFCVTGLRWLFSRCCDFQFFLSGLLLWAFALRSLSFTYDLILLFFLCLTRLYLAGLLHRLLFLLFRFVNDWRWMLRLIWRMLRLILYVDWIIFLLLLFLLLLLRKLLTTYTCWSSIILLALT